MNLIMILPSAHQRSIFSDLRSIKRIRTLILWRVYFSQLLQNHYHQLGMGGCKTGDDYRNFIDFQAAQKGQSENVECL